uniref:Uncharacterized protein n=1 Tax=Caenorhabditis japonica TaxID=281687 RepID=A0A8R1I7P1_CAEJA
MLAVERLLATNIRVTHAALERRLVGISLSEQRQRNLHREAIRAQSDVRDPLLVIKKKKLGWTGHIMRRNDGRWTRLNSRMVSHSPDTICWKATDEMERPWR